MSDKPKLGFKKDIRLKWMNHSLYLTLQGLSESEIRKELDEYLSSQVTESGKPFSNGAINLIKPLLAIWFKSNPISKDFRDALIQEASSCDSSKWLPLHWALMAVEYPLWYHVANQFGRLFSLQDIVTPAQVYSRIKDIYGDTETVSRNARYIIASMSHWGLIRKDSEKNGHYKKPFELSISNVMSALLYESIIIANQGMLDYTALVNHKALFSFNNYQFSPSEIVGQLKTRVNISLRGAEHVFLVHI